MENPLLSIVIPVYGVEKYIEQCVRSLFGQTYPNIEYIFVDDCTPDCSIDIIKKVLEDYPHRKCQIKFIRHVKNEGLSRTREDGIKAASGKYIASCDSDDWVEVEMYAQMVKKAQEEDAQVVICNMMSDSNSMKQIYKGWDILSSDKVSDLLLGHIVPFIHSCVFHRDLISKNHLLFAKADMAEDLVISVSMAYFSKNKISYLEKPYYHYRINEDSISKKKNISSFLKRANGIKENTDLIISFLCQHGLEKKYEQEILLRKHIVKNSIWPVVGNKMAYHLWRNLYPEIHCEILRNRNYSFRTKVLYVLTILGIYPLYVRIKCKNKMKYFH